MKKTGQGTFILANPVKIAAYQAIVGKKEKEGPLGKYFDVFSDDEYFGQKTFEQSEAYMQKEAVSIVLKKAGLCASDVEFIFAGDLLNQCIGSNYGIRDFDLRYFGVYGACSTMAETLILASMAVDGGFSSYSLAVTSSHFCSAERQFRFPLEYGSQRPPSAQWTVTGSGCILLSSYKQSSKFSKKAPVIVDFSPGKICDMNVTDMNNMGSAMAPAAANTLSGYFRDTNTTPDDYDLIVTGDLGSVGHSIVIELLEREKINIGTNYVDCGMMIYDAEKQDVHAGGSGCGCSASVLTGYLIPEMEKGTYKNILFVATGALMSPVSGSQGESIPGIAHLLHIVND